MKWNCNIVKSMHERVIRRKFGLLCVDDSSNKEFIEAYINRLDCTDNIIHCVDNEPCKESSSVTSTPCDLDVEITYEIDETGYIYIFTATVINGTAPYNFDWSYIISHWIFVSQTDNVIQLTPALYGAEVNTGVGITLTDETGCEVKVSIPVDYNMAPLNLNLGYTCNEDNSGLVCATVTGGIPPYTLVGTPGGVIAVNGGSICITLPNGSIYGAFATDSAGNATVATIGLIACPFDCESITIVDNKNIECLTNEFGNTGQATVTLSPSGGTAPYTITGTINGTPGFVNGQTVNHGDVLVITVTDNNGCQEIFNYTIDCPPYVPTPVEYTCEDITAGLNCSIFTNGITASPLVFPLFGHQVDYFISWQLTNLATFGLTPANVANVKYEVSNSSANIYSHFSLPPLTGCNPCSNNVPYLANPQFRAYINSNCGTTKFLNAYIKLTFTIINGEEICTVCFEKNIERSYICDATQPPSGEAMTPIVC